MIGREKRVLLRHYLEQGIPKAEIARHLKISRRTVLQLDRSGAAGPRGGQQGVEVRTQATAAVEARPLQGHHRRAPGRVSEAERRATVQRGAGSRLSGRLRAGEALRARGPATGARGAGPEVRDPSGASGPGGLRRLPAAVGQAARADRGAGLFAADVAEVLRAPDDAGRNAGAGGVVRLLRRRAVGAAVRPDEGRHHRRQAGRGRTADREPGVPALQPALALPDPRMPSVPGPDEGEGRAAGPLYPGQLLLRPGVRVRRRPQRADPAVARWRGERSDPRYAEGARGGSIRPREVVLESLGSLALPSRGAAARALDETDRGTLDTPRRGR